MKALDIVLPCYNPQQDWQKGIESFHASAKSEFVLRFIVVDDGTAARDLGADLKTLSPEIPVDLIRLPANKGKGYAVRKGVSQSESEFVLYTDADFPFSNESTKKVAQILVSGSCDVVAGVRDRAYYEGTMNRFRKALSKSFRFFLRQVLRMKITDTQCGLKAFNRLGREKFLQTRTDRYLFDFEFILTSLRDKKIRVMTTEVVLKPGVVFSKMRLGVLTRESFSLFKILLRRTGA